MIRQRRVCLILLSALTLSSFLGDGRVSQHVGEHSHLEHVSAALGRRHKADAYVRFAEEDRGDVCNQPERVILEERQFEIELKSQGSLGIQFGPGLVVQGFYPILERQGAAERSGLLRVGDRLVALNGDDLTELTTHDAFQVLDEANAASLLAENQGKSRLLTFERGQGTDEIRELSEHSSRHEAGLLEHVDVYPAHKDGSAGEEVVLAALLAEDLGARPAKCPRRPVVFVDPAHACVDQLKMAGKMLDGSIAVVRRGGCSFQSKATLLRHYNVSAVLVINSEDTVFPMTRDVQLNDEEPLDIPVAMLSSGDGHQLERLPRIPQSGVGSRIEARLIVSKECIEREQREEIRARKLATGLEASAASEDRLRRSVPDPQELIGVRHRLVGMLAPAGRIRLLDLSRDEFLRLSDDQLDLAENQVPPERTFDFISASFSGPLPVGAPLGIDTVITVPAERWKPLASSSALLIERLLGMHRPGQDLIALVSDSTSLFRLEAPLPSAVSAAVVMVSRDAGAALQRAIRNGLVASVEPHHNVKHRWDELGRLLQDKQWAADRKQRQRILGRFTKPKNTNGKESHVSQCWTKHIESSLADLIT